MQKPILYLIFFSSLLFLGCLSETDERSFSEIALIPKPQQMKILGGSFTFDKNTTIYVEDDFIQASNFLRKYLKNGVGLSLENNTKELATIRIEKDSSQLSEGYSLTVSPKNIIVFASDASGAFYAMQTIRQLLPSELEEKNSEFDEAVSIPQLEILDAPKFSYRGMHLDVGRHFFPKKFIKEYIANLAMLKMNFFHWHLTEDQGWRIEIKKYPMLTSHSAFRDETLIGHYNDSPQKFDGNRYGGFYSQEDIKEIVAFAAEHQVTIIPEIEMPGHAQAAISAYPELGCTGEQVPVATNWGIFENIYCPNKKTFAFLQDVLTEVIMLFPSEYIHIGGDEAPKEHWKACDHCQKLIKDFMLKDEQGLQSYFIKEIESFLNSKGKKIIGWDEILEGGLAPNATVMSWRGTQGAIEAAQDGHHVILTPGSHAYFDHYQSEQANEPLAIGGYLPLKKVYSFNPIPPELDKDEATFVLGAQGNVWTEYMKTEDKVEYMAYPRMLAMSEVVWRGATEDLESDYTDFLARLELFLKRLDALDVNYANHMYDIEGKLVKMDGNLTYDFSLPASGKNIRYSINSSEQKVYTKPIAITVNSELNAQMFQNGEALGRSFNEYIRFHKGISGTVSLSVDPHPTYSSGGKDALINGISGSTTRYGDKEWLGFWGDDVEITIDLGKESDINTIGMRFYNANGQWIYAPKQLQVFSSEDGKTFTLIKEALLKNEGNIIDLLIELKGIKTQHLRLLIPSYGTIKEGAQGAGHKAWTFIDEIIIE